MLRRVVQVALGTVLLSVLAAGNARAQCAMCGLSAQQSGDPEAVTRTFLSAVAVLLGPVLLVAGCVAGALWKARHWDGALQAGAPASDTPVTADKASSR